MTNIIVTQYHLLRIMRFCHYFNNRVKTETIFYRRQIENKYPSCITEQKFCQLYYIVPWLNANSKSIDANLLMTYKVWKRTGKFGQNA